MGLANCPVCGKLFLRTVRNLCPECLAEEENDYEKVRDYLYKDPGATIEKISEATGVSAKQIMQFLKEGRLELTRNNPNIILRCESCGLPIYSGRFCESCIKELEHKVQGTVGGQAAKGRMHTADFRKTKK